MLARLYRRTASVLAVAVLVVILAGALPVAPALSRALLVRDALRPADAIVVLGGGIHDADLPSTSSTARLVHGLRLQHRGYAPVVILTVGNPDNPAIPEASVMARVAGELGIDRRVLIVERVADRTATQGEAVARIAKERGFRTLLLVTSPEHSYRSVRVFRKTGLEIVSAPVAPQKLPRLSIVISPRGIVEERRQHKGPYRRSAPVGAPSAFMLALGTATEILTIEGECFE